MWHKQKPVIQELQKRSYAKNHAQKIKAIQARKKKFIGLANRMKKPGGKTRYFII
jgi:hypothetical protein